MPHTSSAEKRQRQYEKRRLRNRGRIRAIKKQIKSFEDLLKSGSTDDLKKAYNTAAKLLDKSAAKRTIHPNAAARKKSQLARKVAAKAGK
jgi:small subunit ribosomal protein S20